MICVFNSFVIYLFKSLFLSKIVHYRFTFVRVSVGSGFAQVPRFRVHVSELWFPFPNRLSRSKTSRWSRRCLPGRSRSSGTAMSSTTWPLSTPSPATWWRRPRSSVVLHWASSARLLMKSGIAGHFIFPLVHSMVAFWPLQAMRGLAGFSLKLR